MVEEYSIVLMHYILSLYHIHVEDSFYFHFASTEK